ncbi:MAG: hypothetical protein WC043_06420 [Pseudobdellovibrionaceae bacterium]
MREFLDDVRDFWGNRSSLGKLAVVVGVGYGALCTAFTTAVVRDVILHPDVKTAPAHLPQSCPRETDRGVQSVPYIVPQNSQPEPKRTMV